MRCFPCDMETGRKPGGVMIKVYKTMRTVDRMSCYSSGPTLLELVGHSKTGQFKSDKSKVFFMWWVVCFSNFSLRQNTGLDRFSFGQSPPLSCYTYKMQVVERTAWLCPFGTNSAAKELLNLSHWAGKAKHWLLQCSNFPTLSMILR